MRGSFLLLGALVARAGEASIAKPGGDDIGMRRVEQHLEGLRLMGAEVEEHEGGYVARARRLHGARIALDMPTVTGTENLMMAAVLAEGITVISNAAREPHVYDLARCLIGMGAHITGVGTELIVIEGSGGLLHGTTHNITADYIEAGTYMIAAAATYGDVVVEHMRPSDLRWLFSKLRSAGCDIVEGAHHVRVTCSHLRGVDMTTWPHPGFATDMQPQFCALMTQATGPSVISEALYENRFRHVAFLQQMGARIAIDGRSAVINGPARLHGTQDEHPRHPQWRRAGDRRPLRRRHHRARQRVPSRTRLRRPRDEARRAGRRHRARSPPTSPAPRCAISPAWSATEAFAPVLGKKVGIDLGTTTTRIIVKGEGMIATEPTAVAIRDGGTQTAVFGDAAFETAAGDPEFQLRRPVAGGEIVDAACGAVARQPRR